MIVTYAATRRLYPHLIPAMQSLLAFNKVDEIIVLAEDDIVPDLPEVCRIINVSGQQVFPPDSPNMKSIFTWMALMRVTIAELVPDIDKILQLDVDTIVVDDLTPLWETDLTNKYFAAVPEYKGNYNPFDNPMYFNTGVCLFNLSKMRADNVTEQMVNLLNRRRMYCADQDGFNLIARDMSREIPLRYNECFCCGETDNPAIVHFAGVADWFENPKMHRREFLDRFR